MKKNQLRCCSISEWLNNLWYAYVMGNYLTIKNNEQSGHTNLYKSFKSILLTTINQFGKVICCMIPTQHFGKCKTV